MSTTTNQPDLEMRCGDDEAVSVKVWDNKSSGVARDITGYTLFLTVKRALTDADGSALISVTTSTHTNPTQGESLINVPQAQTSLVPAGTYYYDLQWKDTLSKIKTLHSGRVLFKDQVTQRTS